MKRQNLLKKLLIVMLALITFNIVNVFAGQTTTTKEKEYSMTFCSNGTKGTVPMNEKYFEITSGGAYNEAIYANLREANKTKYYNVNPGIAPGAMGCLVETLMPNDAFTGTVEDGVLRILSKEMTNRNMRDITDAIITYNCTDEVGERCGTTGSTYYAKQVANIVSKEIYPSMELIEYTTKCGSESISYQIPNINTIAASGNNFKRLADGNYEIKYSGDKKLVLNKNVVELTLEGLITLNKEKNDKCSNSSADYGDLTVKILNSKYVNGDKDVEFEVAIFGLPYLNINNDIKDVVFYKTFDDAENKTSNKLTSSYVGTKDNKRIYKVTVPEAARKDVDGCNPATIAVRIVHNSTQSGKYTVSYINTGTSRLYRDILAQELLTGETTQITEKSQCTNVDYMINEDEEYGFECFYKGSSKINQYALGIIDREEFRKDCCGYDKDRILSDKMTKSNYSLYELACTKCFGTGDTMQAKYRENPKEYHLEYSGCCTELNAKEKMGSEEYEAVCNNCFSGKYSLRVKYNQNPGIAQEQYKKCCSESNAKTQMGEIVYNRLCRTGQAKESSKEMVCDTGSNDSYIYEVEEKSIVSQNYEKLMISKDINNKPYEDGRFALNPYCSVYCKEDVDLYFQGLGWNEKTEHRIQSGQYFRFKDYEGQGLLLKNLPTLRQERSCLYKADTESYTLDMYGKSYKWSEIDKINSENITGGYYYLAKKITEAYYNVNQFIKILDLLIESEKSTACNSLTTNNNHSESSNKVSLLTNKYLALNSENKSYLLKNNSYLVANVAPQSPDKPPVQLENVWDGDKSIQIEGSKNPVKGREVINEYFNNFNEFTQYEHNEKWPEQTCCDFSPTYKLDEYYNGSDTVWRNENAQMIKYLIIESLAKKTNDSFKRLKKDVSNSVSAYEDLMYELDNAAFSLDDAGHDGEIKQILFNMSDHLHDTLKGAGLVKSTRVNESSTSHTIEVPDKDEIQFTGIKSYYAKVCLASDSQNYGEWKTPETVQFYRKPVIKGDYDPTVKPSSSEQIDFKKNDVFLTDLAADRNASETFGLGTSTPEIIYEFDKFLLKGISSYKVEAPTVSSGTKTKYQKDANTKELCDKHDGYSFNAKGKDGQKCYKEIPIHTCLNDYPEKVVSSDGTLSGCSRTFYYYEIEHYKRDSLCKDKNTNENPSNENPSNENPSNDPENNKEKCFTGDNSILAKYRANKQDLTLFGKLRECCNEPKATMYMGEDYSAVCPIDSDLYKPDNKLNCRTEVKENIDRFEYLKDIMMKISKRLEELYGEVMNHMTTATANYSDCMNYENAYQATDYPSVTDFYYDEMKLADQQTKEILKELKLTEQENERIVNLAAKPGSKEFEFCEGESNKLVCATDDKNKRRTLPIFINSLNNTDKYESMSLYLTSQSANTSEMIFYDYGKNATDVRVSYNVGIDMYVIKPSGLTVTKNSPMLTDDILKHGRYQMLGFGLPVGLRTRASIYDYRFTVSNLGKTNRMLAYYNKVEQVDNGLHECNYYVGNNIMCPTTEGCFNCEPGDVGCWSNLAQGQMEDPRLMAQPRRVPGADINPTGRELGQNLTTAEAQAAIAHMKEQGGELTSDNLMYSFTLNKETQKAIKSDTKVNGYSNFNLDCDGLGQKCLSPFIDEEFGFDRQASKMRASYYEYDKETDSIVTNSERAEKQPIR